MAHAETVSMDHPWLRHYPGDVDWNADIPSAPLHTLFDEAVDRYSARPAIDFLGRVYTYGQLGSMVDHFARGLQQLGIGKGHRVGLFLPNCPYYIVAYFGALKAGATVVNFNPLYAEREIEHQIQDSGATTMITLDLKALHDKLMPMFDRTGLERIVVCSMAKSLPFPKNWLFPIAKRKDVASIPSDSRHIRFDRLIANDGAPQPVKIDPETDVAVLQYTGGTTGTPKGAMLTHANLFANTVQARLWFAGCQEGVERVMAVIPFFHVFAMTVVMNLGLRIGAMLIALPRFELDQVMKAINDKKPTVFPAVPTIFSAINNHPEQDRFNLSSIKFCLSGGAPLPVDVKEQFEARTGCTLVEGYGLTESSPVASCNPLSGESKAGSIGVPLPRTVIEIMSLEDGRSRVPQGERGEVCIRGPQVMKGYWRKEEETAATLVDGLLHTGDVGYMDEQGYTFIVDRIKDVILAGGYNIYPRYVEEAIYLHPAVAECVVAGVEDPYRGETVKAWIKLVEGQSLTEDALKAFLKDKLSPIEQPKIVEFRSEPLPKTMIGKLSRKTLLEEEATSCGGSRGSGFDRTAG